MPGTQGNNPNRPRGFAAMDAEKQRAIASKGGQSVPPEKRSFSQDRKLAAEAGRKGGEHSHGGRGAESGAIRGDEDQIAGSAAERDRTNTRGKGGQAGQGRNQ